MKVKVYLICDHADQKASKIKGCPNIGIEHLGSCWGRIIQEDGRFIGSHSSTTIGWLRHDLISKLRNPDDWEIVDCIEDPEKIPKHLRTPECLIIKGETE